MADGEWAFPEVYDNSREGGRAGALFIHINALPWSGPAILAV